MVDYKQMSIKQWTNSPCGSTKTDSVNLEYFINLERTKFLKEPWLLKMMPYNKYSGKKVLDIGCGQGNDLVQFAKNGADCYGIDLTPYHIMMAKENFRSRGLNSYLINGDASHLPYEDNTFDLVYSNGVLHHTPDINQCITEIHRVLKPGSRFILILYNKYSAFHITFKLLYTGIRQGELFRLGYSGLLSTIEAGADGVNTKPLVNLYSKRGVRKLLKGFKLSSLRAYHLDKYQYPYELGRFFPNQAFEKYIGWYLVADANKL